MPLKKDGEASNMKKIVTVRKIVMRRRMNSR